MQRKVFFLACLLFFSGVVSSSLAEQTLQVIPVTEPPVIDGFGEENVWVNAPALTTHDKAYRLPIKIKGIYTATEIFFLVSFPDPDESRTHKSWIWDKGRKIYTVGFDREDIFVFKWKIESEVDDLSIYADYGYRADIWFWKACRTDPAGYADDKSHFLNTKEDRNATTLFSRSGKSMYLLRNGDEGQSAYKINLIGEYQGDILQRFSQQQPTGSRADVRAKGTWRNGIWIIEFGRKLITGHKDDIQFHVDKDYLFGVSRYEIAGRPPNAKLSDPLYGTGDVNEALWLRFNQ